MRMGAHSVMYGGMVTCMHPTPMPARSFPTNHTGQVRAKDSAKTLAATTDQNQYMATFLPYRLDIKGTVVIPMICPTDMMEDHPLKIGAARYGAPSLSNFVANWLTKP